MARRSAPTEGWQPDPDRHLSLLFDVFALGQVVRSLLAATMAECGLRADEYAAYSVVFEARELTMTEMARELGMPVTTAADYVRTMRARGHLRREPHPRDSRAYLLALTPAGLRAHRRASAAFERAHEALLAELEPAGEAAARTSLQDLRDCAARALAAVTAAPRRRQRPGDGPAVSRWPARSPDRSAASAGPSPG